mgnify:FL=1
MKKKTKGIIFMIVVVIAFIVIFCNQPVEVNREIRHNTIHKREDIRLVMDKALANMDRDGITVTDVYYDGMESQTFEKNLIHDGYQDAIVVYLDFHTGFFQAPPEFGKNASVSGYQYECVQNSQGEWVFFGNGYR